METQSQQIQNKLFQLYHIKPKAEWVVQCIQFLQQTTNQSKSLLTSSASNPNEERKLLESIYQQFLNGDLSEIGTSSLPKNVADMHAEILSGDYVLQIDEVLNISEPIERRMQEKEEERRNNNNNYSNTKRVLKLNLTDGTNWIAAMEYKSLPIPSFIPPGTKVVNNVLLLVNSDLSLALLLFSLLIRKPILLVTIPYYL